MSEAVAYVNGAVLPEREAKISIFDRAFRFADTVFDTARTVRHRPYKFREHLERLWQSLAYARIDPGLSIEALERITLEVVERNLAFIAPDDDLWVRQFVTRGPIRRVGGTGESGPSVIVTTDRLPFANYAKSYRRGAPMVVASVRSVPAQALDPRMKTTSRMTQNLAEQEVAGVDPSAYALLLDTDGYVSESTGANFFAVIGGTVLTADDGTVLHGISRRTAMELAASRGIPCRPARLTLFDIYNAEEAFITGTSYCLLPIRSVNGKTFGHGPPGPVTRALTEAWIAALGHDFVAQALAHLPPAERAALAAAE
jgi:branched-chain amino acid aminotransferase